MWKELNCPRHRNSQTNTCQTSTKSFTRWFPIISTLLQEHGEGEDNDEEDESPLTSFSCLLSCLSSFLLPLSPSALSLLELTLWPKTGARGRHGKACAMRPQKFTLFCMILPCIFSLGYFRLSPTIWPSYRVEVSTIFNLRSQSAEDDVSLSRRLQCEMEICYTELFEHQDWVDILLPCITWTLLFIPNINSLHGKVCNA